MSDDDFRKAIRLGIAKVNIFTDINKAQAAAAKQALEAGACTAMEMSPYEISAVRDAVEDKMRLFSSNGKA